MFHINHGIQSMTIVLLMGRKTLVVDLDAKTVDVQQILQMKVIKSFSWRYL